MSMEMLEGRDEGVRDYNLERLIMLSDGVFAIAITLLAIELAPPKGWNGTLNGLVAEMWPEFLAYGVSFMAIAFYWASHRRTFGRFRRADGWLTALNFLVLGLVTLVPFGSKMIAHSGPHGQPFLIYLGLVTAIGVANAILWGYAAFLGKGIVDAALTTRFKLTIFLILLVVPTAMAFCGVMSSYPGLWWLSIVMVAVWLAVFGVRRHVGKSIGE